MKTHRYYYLLLGIIFFTIAPKLNAENCISIYELNHSRKFIWAKVRGRIDEKLENEIYLLRDSMEVIIIEVDEDLIEDLPIGSMVCVTGMLDKGIVEVVTLEIGDTALFSRNNPRHIINAKKLSLDMKSYQAIRERKGYHIRASISGIVTGCCLTGGSICLGSGISTIKDYNDIKNPGMFSGIIQFAGVISVIYGSVLTVQALIFGITTIGQIRKSRAITKTLDKPSLQTNVSIVSVGDALGIEFKVMF
jgi:hypothetical protein